MSEGTWKDMLALDTPAALQSLACTRISIGGHYYYFKQRMPYTSLMHFFFLLRSYFWCTAHDAAVQQIVWYLNLERSQISATDFGLVLLMYHLMLSRPATLLVEQTGKYVVRLHALIFSDGALRSLTIGIAKFNMSHDGARRSRKKQRRLYGRSA